MTSDQDAEVLEIESNPTSGFERFTSGVVTITNKPVPFDAAALDSMGKKVVRKWGGTNNCEAVSGIANMHWKSLEHREQCIKYQKANRTNSGRANRWEDVQHYASEMGTQKWDYATPGPVFLHPSVTDLQMLKPVNGARRIMAHLEQHHETFEVIVLRAIAIPLS